MVPVSSYQLRRAAVKALFVGDFKQACIMSVFAKEAEAKEVAERAAMMRDELNRYFPPATPAKMVSSIPKDNWS